MALTQVSRGLLSTSIVDNGNAMAITIDSSENVGIGTSSPATALDVVGTVTADGLTVDKSGGNIAASFINSDSNNSYIQFQNSTTGTTTYTDGSLVGIDSDESLTIWQLESNHIKFGTSATERMRIDASGNVGINTSSPTDTLSVGTLGSGSNSIITIGASTTGTSSVYFGDGVSAGRFRGYFDYEHTNDALAIGTAGTERMRIDASGNLLVGTTTINGVGGSSSPEGVVLDGNNAQITVGTSSDVCATFNRQTTDGSIVQFRKDGTVVGSIGSRSSGQAVTFNSQGGDGVLQNAGSDSYGWNAGYFYPRIDNTSDLGLSILRFNDAYITNGVTTGSDRNQKQDIETLSDAEQRVAVACKGLLRKWRWIDAVEAKGDDARIHFGIIAQDLQAAFEAEGLDAGRYAMFMSNTWTDEETGEERTRLGVRYSELLAFIISAI